MNNARYFELIDTAVNDQLVEATGTDIRDAAGGRGGGRGRPAATSREIGYPAPVDLGLVVEQGSGRPRSSTGSGCSRASGDEAAAEGRFVHVYVDNTDPARPSRADPGRDPGGGRAAAATS